MARVKELYDTVCNKIAEMVEKGVKRYSIENRSMEYLDLECLYQERNALNQRYWQLKMALVRMTRNYNDAVIRTRF